MTDGAGEGKDPVISRHQLVKDMTALHTILERHKADAEKPKKHISNASLLKHVSANDDGASSIVQHKKTPDPIITSSRYKKPTVEGYISSNS
jgi:hypothetical protein